MPSMHGTDGAVSDKPIRANAANSSACKRLGVFGPEPSRPGSKPAGILRIHVLTGDCDNHGWLDFYVTCDSTASLFLHDTNTLYHNHGDGGFADWTSRAGSAIHTQDLKWGTAFIDVDNNGWEDLFIASAHVYPFVGKYRIGESFKQPRQFFWSRRDGQFFDMSSSAGAA